jgi:putative ATP-dependent endonuclease of OLD family
MTGRKNEPVAAAQHSVAKQAGTSEQTASDDKSHPAPSLSGIFIKDVRIRHFRCLRFVDVELEPLTVLIGQNNSGKSSFLNALFAAIGAGQRTISNDDIFLGKNEVSAPKSRAVVVDILIRPTDEHGQITDVFPQGSAWLELYHAADSQFESFIVHHPP